MNDNTKALLSERGSPRPPPSVRTNYTGLPQILCDLCPLHTSMQSVVVSLRWGRPRTDALRLKSVRVLGDSASDRRGRPRTDALRLKSVRVLGMLVLFDGGGRGRTRSD